jgi:hypothetical protein
MEAGEKGNREFGFLLYEFRRKNPQFFGGPQPKRFAAERRKKTLMHHIDLIDWTSAINQLSVDYAKPHLQLLCISGVQISLDAFPGSNPEI